MKVNELIDFLSQFDSNLEVTFLNLGSQRDWEIDKCEIVEGYQVTQSEQDLGHPIYFVHKKVAHSICDDEQTFLDFSSPYIKPSICLYASRR